MTISASRVCPKCTTERPLRDFRRWHGAHRTLHQTCNICDPEVDLSSLPAKEQERRLTLRAAEQRTIERHRERVAKHKAQVNADRGSAMLRRHNLERIRNWNAAIGDALRDECRHAHASRDRHANNHALYANPNPDKPLSAAKLAGLQRVGFFAAEPWVRFYTLYTSILDRIHAQIKDRAHSRNIPTKPTEEETKLSYYLTEEEITKLKILYANCAIPIGVRHRIPWVIEGVDIPRSKAGRNLPASVAERRERIARAAEAGAKHLGPLTEEGETK